MNKKLRFFKLLAALFLMLIPAEQPVGQNITYEFPGIQLKNSIIRSYDAKKSFIIYTDDGANRKFSYFDPTSSNDVSADFTSANVIVNDIHLYMIADVNYFVGGTMSNDYRCVVDVWETGSGGGDFTANEEFSGVYFFNDLVITDNKNPIFKKYVGNGKYIYRTFNPIVINVTRDYICK